MALPRTLCTAASETVDVVVVGAGVVGLAIARSLALAGREVIVLESEGGIGTGTSSRNSEVIHAGIYYPPGSLKARLCVTGREALYDYCAAHDVAHNRVGKLVVATNPAQVSQLQALQATGLRNGSPNLEFLSASEAHSLEPELRCTAAVLSPSTGIVDSHGLMAALQADAESAGAVTAVHSRVSGGNVAEPPGAHSLHVEDTTTSETSSLRTRCIVNAAGLQAQDVAARLRGLPPEEIPPLFLARGCYFALSGKAPFSRLVYPLPEPGGLGVHLTIDLGGQAKFGPDVEWVDTLDYTVDPARAAAFYPAIRAYYPGLKDGVLQPSYAGIRPKLSGPGQPPQDFMIQGPEQHGVQGLVNLFGIESPGLTASLSIAEHVKGLLDR